MTAPMHHKPQTTIAQITDLHIKQPGALAYGRVETAPALTALVSTLAALQPRPDLVVVTGDLVDTGTPAEYAHLAELLRPLALPLLVCPGNHDDRQALRAAFPAQRFATAHACNTRHELGALLVLLLDSSVPGQSHGSLDDETLAWLREELGAARGRPVLLFLHHPPFHTGIAHMDRQNLRNADALATLVREHGHVQLVAAGHAHRAVFTRFAGSIASIAPAPSHAVALDLIEALPPSFRREPPGFHLHLWTGPEQGIVTHQVPVGAFDGPHPFFDGNGRLL
jgi:3',5'-cyclic AMP phosphodiesterase CpdA